ncbi:hypothetical protein C8R46DRAFT_822583, partial [Mycena filopes]
AFYLHLRIMWGSFDGSVVPELPTPERVAAFAIATGRYVSPDDLDSLTASLNASYATHVNGAVAAVDDLRRLAATTKSTIAKNVLQMDEDFLRTIYSAILGSGLEKWRPDVLGNFGSMYNHIAIKTLQQVATSHGYSRLSPNLTNVQNMALLKRFYRNYNFSHIYKLAMKETKLAGSVKQTIANTNTYKRRQEMVNDRAGFLRSEGYRSRTVALAEEPECHSDDE